MNNKNSSNKTSPQTDKLLSIEAYRNAQKSKNRLQFFMWMVLVVALTVVGYVVAKEMEMNTEIVVESGSLSANLKGETPLALHENSGGFVVTTTGSVGLYDFNLKKKTGEKHGFSKPITKTAGSYSLTYESGGYGLLLQNGVKAVKTRKMEQKILFCHVDSSGKVAVVTKSPQYTSQLTVYDDSLTTPIFVYSLNEHIMGFDFVRGNVCVVATQSVDNGGFQSILYGLDIKKETPIFETKFSSSMILSVSSKYGGAIAMVCSEQLFFIDAKGQNVEQYPYPNRLLFVDNDSRDGVVLAIENSATPDQATIFAFEDTAQVQAQATVSGVLRDIQMSQHEICVLTDNQLTVFDRGLVEKDRFEHQGQYRKMQNSQYGIVVLEKDKLQKITQ